MPHYVDGKRVDVPTTHTTHSQDTIIEKTSEINVDELAAAVAKAIGGKVRYSESGEVADGFDDGKTLEQLAKTMTVQRGGGDSNFKDLGNTVETKKDKEETDATIEFLKGVDD